MVKQSKTDAAAKQRSASSKITTAQRRKAEEEREQYTRKIESNEERLRSGLMADGKPLSPSQIAITQEILARQRHRVEELTSAVSNTGEDPR